jgi:hypothetical protein
MKAVRQSRNVKLVSYGIDLLDGNFPQKENSAVSPNQLSSFLL